MFLSSAYCTMYKCTHKHVACVQPSSISFIRRKRDPFSPYEKVGDGYTQASKHAHSINIFSLFNDAVPPYGQIKTRGH